MTNNRATRPLAVSVVVYQDDRSDLLKLLNSLQGANISLDIYVVDNSPSDSLRDFFSDYPSVSYHFNNGINQGYGAGHNSNLQPLLMRYAYHLVINPDIYFGAGTLEGLFQFMERNPGTGLVMPKVMYPDGRLQYLCKRFPRPFDLFARRFLPSKWHQKRQAYYEMRDLNYDESSQVPMLSGCFMFFRAAALQEVGLFDERFFLYFEDYDLSYRIGQKYACVYYPEVQIFHVHRRASYYRATLLKYHIQSAIRFFNKYGWQPIY